MCIRDSHYTLNGGPTRPLAVGPDNMRLARPGDFNIELDYTCLLYTSDAADERSSVDLGGRRIIKKKKKREVHVNVSV